MEIETLTVGQLQTNCYLVWDRISRRSIILDPGDDAELIINRLRDLNLHPQLILATHGHYDHLLAAHELKWAFNIPLHLHASDAFLVRRLRESTFHWLGTESGPPPAIDRFLKENEVIRFGQSSLSVLETPGHTPGSICLISQNSSTIFSGDTLFHQGVGRTDLSYSSPTALENSLEKLFKLPADTVVYPGHGGTTTVGTASAGIRF